MSIETVANRILHSTKMRCARRMRGKINVLARHVGAQVVVVDMGAANIESNSGAEKNA